MAFNPHSTYRGDYYIYGGLAGLGSGIADAINGWRARENENAELGSYLAEVGLPQERIDSMDLSQRRGLQKALDFKMEQNKQAALQKQMESESAYKNAQTDLAMLGLDSKRSEMADKTAALEMLGANYRGYYSQPENLRNPDYDPIQASMDQALAEGKVREYLALQGLKPTKLKFYKGPNGITGWSYGNQGGVVSPKASGSDSLYASPDGKALYDARIFEMMGMPAEAAAIRDKFISKIFMDDGYSDLDLIMLKNGNKQKQEEYKRIMQNRAARRAGWKHYSNLVNNPQANFVGEMPPAVNEAPMPAAAQPNVPVTQLARGSVDRIIKARK